MNDKVFKKSIFCRKIAQSSSFILMLGRVTTEKLFYSQSLGLCNGVGSTSANAISFRNTPIILNAYQISNTGHCFFFRYYYF